VEKSVSTLSLPSTSWTLTPGQRNSTASKAEAKGVGEPKTTDAVNLLTCRTESEAVKRTLCGTSLSSMSSDSYLTCSSPMLVKFW
jgi:hypothetical protein